MEPIINKILTLTLLNSFPMKGEHIADTKVPIVNISVNEA